jgi:chromosome segregation ATPase
VRKLNADIRDLQSQQGSLSKLNESLLAQSQSLESLLQGKHSALIAVQKSLSTEQGEKQEIIQKCDQMQRERDSAMKRCKEMQSRLDEIEQEMKGLKDSNSLSRDREEQAKKKTSALTREVQQITGQNTLLKNRLESLTAAYTTAHAALHSATSSNATLQNTLTQYSSKITVLKSNILSFLTLQKDKSMSHKQRYLEEVARLTAKNQGLSKALEKSVELIKGLQSVADTKVLESSSVRLATKYELCSYYCIERGSKH